MVSIVVCDDNIDYQEIISEKIRNCMNNTFNMECDINCFNNLNDLSTYLEFHKTDIIFLDIMIDSQNAMDWSIDNIHNKYTQLIFMTAFPQSAYNISETKCCYFLMKSKLSESNLVRALQKALTANSQKNPNLINVKVGSKNFIINSQDIIYIESFSNSISIHIKGMDNLTVYSSLKSYQKTLPPNFFRCHKCYLVNMNQIKRYEPHKFIMSSEDEIPLPSKKYKDIIAHYQKYLMNL